MGKEKNLLVMDDEGNIAFAMNAQELAYRIGSGGLTPEQEKVGAACLRQHGDTVKLEDIIKACKELVELGILTRDGDTLKHL